MRYLLGLLFVLMSSPLAVSGVQVGNDDIRETDYLTFAQGAVPLSISAAGQEHRATFEHAVSMIDGNPGGFSMLQRATADTDVEFVYQLPAPTTFTRFAIPNVLETPSPFQTFFQTVEVYGSNSGAEEGFTLLASATLTTHTGRGMETDLEIHASEPVRWVRVRLAGGIEMLRDQMFLEFSEIIGNGVQESSPLSDAFGGGWRDRGVSLLLRQDGPTVSGCYDRGAPLSGTVSGNILRARGVSPSDGTISLFILAVADDGSVRGVRSDNGGPFRLYTGAGADEGFTLDCPDLESNRLGCGSVIHGINFDFDSADIRDDSEPILAALFSGLQSDQASSIVIEGFTSSEGAEDYNLNLSERRAAAVVQDVISRGLSSDRISSAGRGEADPIASNDDESGRSMNRRVEVRCG